MNLETLDRMLVGESRLHDLMKLHMAWVSKCLADGTHRSWTPSLAALVKESPADEGELWLHVLDVPFNEHDEKHRALRTVGRQLYEQRRIPVALVLSSECWLSKQRGGLKAPHCEPRHDPARQEGIMIQGLTMGNRHSAMAFAPVESDAEHHMKVEPFGKIMPGAECGLLSSLFLGFFEKTAEKAGIKLPE